jgi:aspartyl-tRNA(Asn)/glutamyl-tRNA(Gln) amidotransferase subunit A
MSEPLDFGLCAAAALVAKGEISPSELTAAAIARVEADPGARDCFIRFDRETAMAQARRLDDRSEALPLRGIPLAHKDLFAVPGEPVSFAAHERFHLKGSSTADALAALEAAGAVNLGGLHLSEFAMGPAGWAEHYGFLPNPRDPQLVTGGSSSGSAAAVARKLVFGALGTDTGGSIRIPAAFCGIVGLKPSLGLVPTRGCFEVAESLDVIGPMTRDVEDCAAMLDALAPGAGYEAALSERPALRFGVLTAESLPAPPDAAVASAFDNAVDTLRKAGCDIGEIRIPNLVELGALSGVVFLTEAAAVHATRLKTARELIGPQVAERLLQGLAFPGAFYLRAKRARDGHLAELRRNVFSQFDVLLLPTCPSPPPAQAVYEAMPDVGAILDFNGRLGAYTPAFSYLGVPALSLPFGGGFGLQMVADFRQEATLLQAARTAEIARDGA